MSCLSSCFSHPARSPPSPRKARIGSFEGGNTGSRNLKGPCRSAKKRVGPSVQPPAGRKRRRSHIETLPTPQAESDRLHGFGHLKPAYGSSGSDPSENRIVCPSR